MVTNLGSEIHPCDLEPALTRWLSCGASMPFPTLESLLHQSDVRVLLRKGFNGSLVKPFFTKVCMHSWKPAGKTWYPQQITVPGAAASWRLQKLLGAECWNLGDEGELRREDCLAEDAAFIQEVRSPKGMRELDRKYPNLTLMLSWSHLLIPVGGTETEARKKEYHSHWLPSQVSQQDGE